jgi:hypothetical protein
VFSCEVTKRSGKKRILIFFVQCIRGGIPYAG